MANLVQIPWQPGLYLTPDTLDLLTRAGNRLGTQLRLVGQDAAWRSYERQFYLYDLYKHHGGNTASSPDAPGQRMHMRGGAFDLISTSAPVQAACRAVGLVRDSAEPWHWNNPRLTSMPIIPTLTNTAGGGGTPIGEEDMNAEQEQKLTSARDEAHSANVTSGWANQNAANAVAKAEEARAQALAATETAQWANENADKARIAAEKARTDILARLDSFTPGNGSAIDYAALAKAVNDDAARRLAS